MESLTGAITITHDFDEAEANAVRTAAVATDPLRLKMKIFGGVLALISLPFLLAPEPRLTDALGWIGIGAFWLFLGMAPPAWLRKGVKLPSRSRGPDARSLDDAGLHIRGEGTEFDLAWSAMKRIAETPAYLLFIDAGRSPHHLTKARMSAAELDGMRALISSRARKKPQLLRA